MNDHGTQSVWANDRLRLLVTASCNINCFYCHNEGQAKGDQFLSDALFAQIVEVGESTPPKSVTFTGGEALLHPRLNQLVQTARSFCPSVTLVTNGILLDRQRLQSLVEAGITKIRFGVDSFSGDKSRPSSNPFPTIDVKQRIKEIQESGTGLELNIVLTKFNLIEMPELFRFCADNRISAKIFEHIEVERFGTQYSSAEIHRKPVVDFPELEKLLQNSGVTFETVEAPRFYGANLVLIANGFSWRYCRYLCPYGLCYMTGTRIDSTGASYVCMEKRFIETIFPGDPLATTQRKLRRVNENGCCRRTV